MIIYIILQSFYNGWGECEGSQVLYTTTDKDKVNRKAQQLKDQGKQDITIEVWYEGTNLDNIWIS
jgi:hypothetical protein